MEIAQIGRLIFSVDAALCMKIGAKLREGVSAYPYLRQGLFMYAYIYIHIKKTFSIYI